MEPQAVDADRELEPLHDPGPAAPPSLRTVALGALGDESLVELASTGDARALECLYRRHAPFALNLAARIAGRASDIEDIVHDSFLRAFDALGRLKRGAAFRPWLGSIVVNAVRSSLRRERLRRVLGFGGQPVELDCIASAEASPAVRAELAQIYALLQTLPADDRIAWTLRYVEGYDLEGAASLVGCSLATIKRRILRAERYIDGHFVGRTTLLRRDGSVTP